MLRSALVIVAWIAACSHACALSADAITGAITSSPLAVLLLQVMVVVAAAKIVGELFLRIGQPAVIGEMVAGILLGPSLLGHFYPAAQAALFPPSSLQTLQLLSQFGIVLFMFFVGLELDMRRLQKHARTALMVSASSILLPFAFGAGLALLMYPELAGETTSLPAFALFIATALSVTAFPVLARILVQRNLTHTDLGHTAIACAAVDDISAWGLLAVVVAFAQSTSVGSAFMTILLAVVFFGGMVLLRPRLNGWLEKSFSSRQSENNGIAAVLLFVFLCAFLTEKIGMHAIFGAFVAGAIMLPQAQISRVLQTRVETFAGTLLLPLFFAFTGLRTEIGALNSAGDWLMCGLITLVAIVGKFGGSYLAARWAGEKKQKAAAIGILMNTRGLMEVVVLNIGYDLGLLSTRAFTMMVIMALITTVMTGPLLDFLEKRSGVKPKGAHPVAS